ncbi:MAG: FAD-dependent oxidoreductase [Candidatus Omnitrophica bacterium]|nr:FAD-dependent oxidoreductase [Candidatus Omnitrophota bacterium]
MKTRITQIIERVADVVSFRCRPEQPISFLPGQFAQIVFDPDNLKNKDLNKYLSFSAAPGQADLEFTKKLTTSAFSQKIAAFKPGDPLVVNGPLGSCVFKPEYQKICFIVGGIGITPVISILEYIVREKLSTDVVLLYSNWTEKTIAFKPQLDDWSKWNSRIKIVHTVVQTPPADKTLLFGLISPEMIRRQIPDVTDRVAFVFGPPGMVKATKEACHAVGCIAEKLKIENFLGY